MPVDPEDIREMRKDIGTLATSVASMSATIPIIHDLVKDIDRKHDATSHTVVALHETDQRHQERIEALEKAEGPFETHEIDALKRIIAHFESRRALLIAVAPAVLSILIAILSFLTVHHTF